MRILYISIIIFDNLVFALNLPARKVHEHDLVVRMTSVVAQRLARLVLGWWPSAGRYTVTVRNQPHLSTQPSHPRW